MSVVKRNLKEAGDKVPNQGTRIASGIPGRMRLLNKSKSKKLSGCWGVNAAVTWDGYGSIASINYRMAELLPAY